MGTTPRAKPRQPRSTAKSPAPPAAQAAAHARTRRARSTEIAEDYAETIADLIADSGEARVVDIARRIGVTHVTVVRTVARLQRDGLVATKPYRAISLTDAGKRLADRSRRRHQIVVDFLLALKLPPAIAHADAEGIEHHVSPQTLAAFERFAGKAARRKA
jgi:DtxR family manganese transport transcriptional regulator